MNRWTDGWMDGWINEGVDRWMNGLMDILMNRYMDLLIVIHVLPTKKPKTLFVTTETKSESHIP